MAGGELGTITTDLPARLDRLPWALEAIAKPLTAQDAEGNSVRASA